MKIAEKHKIIIGEKPGLAPVIASIRKDFGVHSIMWYGEQIESFTNYEVMDTGLFGLNAALGNFGLVKGRQLEIYGPESSGKTTLMKYLIGRMQRLGGLCAFIDVEHSFDPTWAKKNGCDLESLLVCQPDSAEEALVIVEKLCSSGALDLVVLDSIGGLVSNKQKEKTADDNRTVAATAGMLTDTSNRVKDIISKNKTIMCWINQVRENINISPGSFGSPKERVPGPRAHKHNCTYRIDIRRISTIKQDGVPIGIESKIKVVKNKVSSPYRETTIEILFDDANDMWGVWRESDVFSVANALGLFDGKRVRSYNGEVLADGIFACKVALRKNNRMLLKLEEKIKSIYNYSKLFYFNKKISELSKQETISGDIKETLGISGIDVTSISDSGDKAELIKELERLMSSGVSLGNENEIIDIEPEKKEPIRQEELEEPEIPDLSSLMAEDSDEVDIPDVE